MKRWLLLLAALACLSPALRADDEAPAPADPKDRSQWSQRGLEVGLGLSSLSVFNGAPLGYVPLDLGWRFGNGLRTRVGLLLFYYEGVDKDKDQPALPAEVYSYEMVDLRASLEYVVPLPFWVRPVAGLSVDVVSGTRHRTDPNAATRPNLGAWSVLAPGALLGLELRGGPGWSLDLLGRYAHGFTETGPFASADLSWHYLF